MKIASSAYAVCARGYFFYSDCAVQRAVSFLSLAHLKHTSAGLICNNMPFGGVRLRAFWVAAALSGSHVASQHVL